MRCGDAAYSAIWAVMPVKEIAGAKQRLSRCCRRRSASVSLRSCWGTCWTLSAVAALAGVVVVTMDTGPRRSGAAARRADDHRGRAGWPYWQRHRRGAGVGGAKGGRRDDNARRHPGGTAAEMDALFAAHGAAPAFTISPAHDDKGSNARGLIPPGIGDAALRRGQLLPAPCRGAGAGHRADRVP